MPLSDRFILAGIGGALLLAGAAGWMLSTPAGMGGKPSSEPVSIVSNDPFTSERPAQSTEPELVIDVEGGVAEPGIQRLPAGSRLADAIVAAGGFAPDADTSLASRQLNLAAALTDGQQIYVPRQGDGPGTGSPGGSAGTSPGGKVNLNQASPEQLDGLPGIGPVTVQKIVAARQQQPFRTLDELVERKVLTTSQLSKIRDLSTV